MTLVYALWEIPEPLLRAGVSFIAAGGTVQQLERLLALRLRIEQGPDPEQADSARDFQRLAFAKLLVETGRIGE